MNIYQKILSLSPWLEVIIKTFYWRSKFIYNFLSSKKKTADKKKYLYNNSFELVKKNLKSLNAGDTEIMIVHSSMTALKFTGLTPIQICDELISFLGPKGTLAMPAFPIFKGQPFGPDRLKNTISKERLVYDVQRTRTWTGAIPQALMKKTDAIRSRHPLNTMVAFGPQALNMMTDNIKGDLPMPCGPHSSWKYCADRDAAIVCLGVDTSHSLTMIHVAEDSWSQHWPISNWYRERIFTVKDKDFIKDISVLERHPKWSINYAERTLQKDLIREGIIKVKEIENIRIEICSSAKLINYLTSKRKKPYPYWIPLWDRFK
jgi:aminoglycoside 3-N-acetyltransferase